MTAYMNAFLFELKESLMIALRAIRANKFRSFLTMLGIIIGVTVVVLMTTAIKGIDNSFQKGISALGSDVIYVDKYTWFSNTDFWKMRNRPNITMDDYNKFKQMVKLPAAVAPTMDTRQNVKYQSRTVDGVAVSGSDADYVKTTNFTFDQGRFYTAIESNAARNVCVLGSEVASSLFPMGNAIDKEIKIGTQNFKVVGVLAEQGSFILGNFNPDKRAYIPIGTIAKYFSSHARNSITINVKATSPAAVEDTKAETIGIMRKIRGLKYNEEDNFGVNQQEGLLDNYNKVVGTIQIAGLFITGLSLFVGAIGIMNIMFVSVRERTKEIGLRKAIGAKRRTILAQFLLESTVICLVGGLIGLILAVLASMVVNQFIPTSVQYGAVVLAIVVSLITRTTFRFCSCICCGKNGSCRCIEV